MNYLRVIHKRPEVVDILCLTDEIDSTFGKYGVIHNSMTSELPRAQYGGLQ